MVKCSLELPFFCRALVERVQFFNTTRMAILWRGVKPRLERVDGYEFAHEARTKTEYVGVIVFARQTGRRGVVHQRRAYPRHFVRRDRNTDARTTDCHSHIAVSFDHASTHRFAKVGIVNGGQCVSRAQVHYVVAPSGQRRGQYGLQLEASVIGTKGDAHRLHLTFLNSLVHGGQRSITTSYRHFVLQFNAHAATGEEFARDANVRKAGLMRSIVVMGVSGSGKTTIASGLALRLGSEYIDADWLHSPESIAKMAAGQPLDDVDRSPWLHLVGQQMKKAESDEMRTVVACSALKRTYRDILREYVPDAFFVFLDGSLAQIRERIATCKSGVPASLLTSQFATLKGLQDDELGIRVDISLSPQEIIDQIVEKLGVWITPSSK